MHAEDLTHHPLFFYLEALLTDLKIMGVAPPAQQPSAQDRQLREAAQMYEQHFLMEMIKAMRSTVDHSGLVPQSAAESLFQQKLDQEYAEEWAQSGGIGLADMIYQQIKEKIDSSGGL